MPPCRPNSRNVHEPTTPIRRTIFRGSVAASEHTVNIVDHPSWDKGLLWGEHTFTILSCKRAPLDSPSAQGPSLGSYYGRDDVVHPQGKHASLKKITEAWKYYWPLLSPYISPLQPLHIIKSLLISVLVFLLYLVFSERQGALPLITFMVTYGILFLETKVLTRLQVKKKSKDPATLKIKEKIHFYESFNENDSQQNKLTPPSARRRNQDDFYRGYRTVDTKKNNIYKRSYSQQDTDFSPPQQRLLDKLEKLGKKELIDDVDETSEGSSSLLSVLQMEHPTALEKHNSFLDTKNELTDLAREKKVKSTLVLLKKQHPSFVEGTLLYAANICCSHCTRAIGLDIARANNVTYSKSSMYHASPPYASLIAHCILIHHNLPYQNRIRCACIIANTWYKQGPHCHSLWYVHCDNRWRWWCCRRSFLRH